MFNIQIQQFHSSITMNWNLIRRAYNIQLLTLAKELWCLTQVISRCFLNKDVNKLKGLDYHTDGITLFPARGTISQVELLNHFNNIIKVELIHQRGYNSGIKIPLLNYNLL